MSAPYYRINDLYYDQVGGGLYICTGAGYSTASTLSPTSAWKQISGGGGTGWQWGGLWTNPSGGGTINTVYQVSTGTSAGLYLCLLAGNTNNPDTGTGWVQMSNLATWL